MPNDLVALFAEAVRLHQAGHIVEAEVRYRTLLARQPNHADALHLLGVVAYQQGHPEPALALIDRAIALRPDVSDYRNHAGLALDRLGRPEAAIAAFREALRLRPAYPEAHNNLGNALHRAGRSDDALAAIQQALWLRPDYAEAHTNLGNILLAQGKMVDAVDAYRAGVRLGPGSTEAHFNLGVALHRAGRPADAIHPLRTALRLAPRLSAVQLELALVLHAASRSEEAVVELKRLIAGHPDDAEGFLNLGLIYHELGIAASAELALREAFRLRPDDPHVLNQLSIIARARGEMDEAIALAQRALAIAPDHGEARNTLGNAFKDIGDVEGALAEYRRAIESPRPPRAAYPNFLLTLHYRPESGASDLADEHRRWAERYAAPLRVTQRPHDNSREPDRRLRIGYVSPDLREHAVARFLLPLLQHHDRTQFEVHAFSTVRRPDDMTGRLRSHVDAWHDVARHDDDAVAAAIRSEKIDVLVDLAAHAAGSSLLVFARQPAPVQVSYLAYCSTTGLDTMNYRLSDPHLDPPEAYLGVYAEKTIRLPRTYWCYAASQVAPEVNDLPALRLGQVTFGCLNNYAKVNSMVLRLWAEILSVVPRARLMLHAPRGMHRERVKQLFATKGVSGQRLQFLERAPLADFFRFHHEIDVALDPFPFNGGTTTCDALWMGVPVVSLSGGTAVSRSGRSLLTNVGLPHLAVRTPTDYVQAARILAGDLSALAALRRELRSRMLASPLMDAPGFGRDLASACRAMWREWCGAVG